MRTETTLEAPSEHAGQKFFVNIEGQEYAWDKPTITVPEIRQLGNLPTDQPVICEDEEGRERTLAENETITIKPGHRHGRAPKYKRG
jgi:hypothetical protein